MHDAQNTLPPAVDARSPDEDEASPAVPSGRFRECAASVDRLYRTLLNLERQTGLLKVPPLAGREWFDLLRQKLIPQLRDDAFLVVAVVGGTNIGKSVIFNHVAGGRASATSPLASGTRYPVCLVPPGFADTHNLETIFEGFRLVEWSRADAALEERGEHLLFWRTSDRTPENLLVLDTPDIDSDAPINWQRADHIRRCADVLIAVLTQQKYNDAAVKQFFRKAAAEDKAVLIVFNQCQLPEDEEYWPLWLGTFCRETGINPEIVYVAPSDRRAAEANELPFYERPWPVDDRGQEAGGRGQESDTSFPGSAWERTSGRSASSDNATRSVEPLRSQAEPGNEKAIDDGQRTTDTPRSLTEDLSRLRFAEIKLRSLRGSIGALLDAEDGVPGYLREIDLASGRFRSAAEILSADKLARLDSWPAVPNALLVDEIRRWWQSQREGWSRKVHGFYNTVGTGITWPFRYAREKIKGEQTPPIEVYRRREWTAILETVEKAYERLTMMTELGNPLLKERLDRVLGGKSRADLLEQLEREHAQVDLQQELADQVVKEMRTFRDESPQFYTFLKRLDKVAAAVRPATSVVLFVVGFGPAGDAAAHVVTDTAIQTVVHAAGDVAGGTVAAAVGDTAISGTASSGLGLIEAKFRRMHSAFAARRVAWLIERLNEHLWGGLLEELSVGAGVSASEAFRDVDGTLEVLGRQVEAA